MKALLRALAVGACRLIAGGACGLLIAGAVWLVVEIDNDELQAGKSPHSGFCPDSPEWGQVPEKGFDGLNKSSRTGSGSARSNNQ